MSPTAAVYVRSITVSGGLPRSIPVRLLYRPTLRRSVHSNLLILALDV